MKASLRVLITQGIDALRQHGKLPADVLPPPFVVERPKTREHGDFATNVSLILAKAMHTPPRQTAQALVDAFPQTPLIRRIEVAGPGFINFHLTPQAYHQEILTVIKQGDDYGRNLTGNSQTVGVEYVSANPTGPLHVGHGRAAAIGDCLSRLLEANGWSVKREFYYNDAGAQIDTLVHSVKARIDGFKPGDREWPDPAYNGEYIRDVANAYMSGDFIDLEGQIISGLKDPNDLVAIRRFAVAYLRHEQNKDLAAFNVDFDIFFLESSLYTDGNVEHTIAKLIDSGYTYEEGGALWLRSSAFGDDKDRVMRKSDGTYTYFVPDIAYHWTKWQRGYKRAITELGADHHGSLARMHAGLQALDVGIPQNWPEYVLHQMVTVVRDGQEVKLGKRLGGYLTLRDVIEETSADAARWFLISRKPDSQITFDINLARQQTNENPVYYVQYAHARICSLLRQAQEKKLSYRLATKIRDLKIIVDENSLELMQVISRFPETVHSAGELLEPHLITLYLRELAHVFHTWYHASPVLVDDEAERSAKLTLAIAARHVLKSGLSLLGVSTPEKM